MKYYKMIYDYENDYEYINCSIGHIGDLDEYVTSKGKRVIDWEKVVFEYNSNEGHILTDYVANVYRWLIVSNNFQNKIEKLVTNEIQYLPVTLWDNGNRIENSSYKIANILNVLDVLDLDNSQYDVFELDDQKLISVEKYALIKLKIRGHHIFRLKDDTTPIFVSDQFKEIVEESDLLGFAFIEVVVK